MIRRRLFLGLLVAASFLHASDPGSRPAVDAIGITVSNLERSVDFFTGVLRFEKVREYEVAGAEFDRASGVFAMRARTARLRLGDEHVELTQYLAPPGRSLPEGSRSNDRWFQHIAIVVSDMDAAYEHLRAHRVRQVSPEPQRIPDWNKNAAGIRAFYFLDRDGHALEIIWFPPGKGASKWQAGGGRLFLGIDHTAIVVEDTETSLRFYRDTLGLAVAGESENYGPEQERLNGVFGARLRITALRGSGGPGIEFLEYVSPRDGLPYPSGARANDLVHWQTRLVTPSAAPLADAIRRSKARLVSPSLVDLPGNTMEFRRALLARDPDGHAVQVVER